MNGDVMIRDVMIVPIPDVRAPEVPGWETQPSTSGRPSLEAVLDLQSLDYCASGTFALLNRADSSTDESHAGVGGSLDGVDDFLVCCEFDDPTA